MRYTKKVIILGLILGIAADVAFADTVSEINTDNSSEDKPILAILNRFAPNVIWGRQLRVSLDGDNHPDIVVLGNTEKEVVVAVVLGARPKMPEIFRFPSNPNAQNGVCGAPPMARIEVEKCPTDAIPKCQLISDSTVTKKRDLEAVRLDAGDCDAFHFYFDGQKIVWWRR